jgi:hypothetical protein
MQHDWGWGGVTTRTSRSFVPVPLENLLQYESVSAFELSDERES